MVEINWLILVMDYDNVIILCVLIHIWLYTQIYINNVYKIFVSLFPNVFLTNFKFEIS